MSDSDGDDTPTTPNVEVVDEGVVIRYPAGTILQPPTPQGVGSGWNRCDWCGGKARVTSRSSTTYYFQCTVCVSRATRDYTRFNRKAGRR